LHMLPSFPQFKSLEFSDKSDIENITSQHPPYSDFNFTSMLVWNVKGSMRVSEINRNLVVCFEDYMTGEPFYSFLGTNKIEDTADKLLALSKKEGLRPFLKLIPEEAAIELSKEKYLIVEDRDNFDYVYATQDLVEYPGPDYSMKRRMVRSFWKNYPDAIVRTFGAEELLKEEKVLGLYERWVKNKTIEEKEVDAFNETAALKRFFSSGMPYEDFLEIGIFHGEKLIGFSLVEFLHSDHIISHFLKADTDYVGVYPCLLQEGKKIAFLRKKKSFFNFEQDLGIPGLRKSKMLFRQKHFLKKFIVSPKTE